MYVWIELLYIHIADRCRDNTSRYSPQKQAEMIALDEKQGFLGPEHHRRGCLIKYLVLKEITTSSIDH